MDSAQIRKIRKHPLNLWELKTQKSVTIRKIRKNLQKAAKSTKPAQIRKNPQNPQNAAKGRKVGEEAGETARSAKMLQKAATRKNREYPQIAHNLQKNANPAKSRKPENTRSEKRIISFRIHESHIPKNGNFTYGERWFRVPKTLVSPPDNVNLTSHKH